MCCLSKSTTRLTLVLIVTLSACAPAATPMPPTATNPPPTLAPTAVPTNTPAVTVMPAPTATRSAQDLAADIDKTMQMLVWAGAFSGSVLVARNGEVILNQGYGLADREKKTPNTSQTKFPIASITKQFTAMAIMLLQEQGKLNVQDKICAYLKDCPTTWQSITIHQLLTHTSGSTMQDAGCKHASPNIGLACFLWELRISGSCNRLATHTPALFLDQRQIQPPGELVWLISGR